MNRPYVILSCAMSIDGYLDSAAPHKLAMSNAADFDRVDQLRADSDAIMVGASTVRRDDPRLLVRSDERQLVRLAAGKSSSPTKVTVTASGDLPPQSAFFTEGDVEKLVYCPRWSAAHDRGQRSATSRPWSPLGAARDDGATSLADLAARGVRRLMVEGGGRLHTQFLVDELVDELQLVIAPFFVGESRAPRFVEAGRFPWTSTHRATLADTRRIGDVVLLRYALSDRFAAERQAPAATGGLARAVREGGHGGRRIRRGAPRGGAGRRGATIAAFATLVAAPLVAGRAGGGHARRAAGPAGGVDRRACWCCSPSPWRGAARGRRGRFRRRGRPRARSWQPSTSGSRRPSTGRFSLDRGHGRRRERLRRRRRRDRHGQRGPDRRAAGRRCWSAAAFALARAALRAGRVAARRRSRRTHRGRRGGGRVDPLRARRRAARARACRSRRPTRPARSPRPRRGRRRASASRPAFERALASDRLAAALRR